MMEMTEEQRAELKARAKDCSDHVSRALDLLEKGEIGGAKFELFELESPLNDLVRAIDKLGAPAA
jgi:hypothetical protein